MAAFDFETIAREDGTHWVVAEIRPGPGTGAAHIPGAYMPRLPNGKLGPAVIPPGASLVFTIEGKMRAIATLTGMTPNAEWDYHWEIPDRYRSRRGRDECAHDKCASPDGPIVVICRDNPGVQGPQQYRPAFLLPRDWADRVKPALELYQKDRALFRADAAATNRDALLRRVASENPLLAIAAFRTLCQSGQPGEAEAANLILKANGVQQGAFLALFLKHAPKERAGSLARLLVVELDKGQSLERFAGLAVGANVARSPWFSPPAAHQAAEDLLVAMRRRFRSAARPTPTDEFFEALFRSCRLPDEPGR